MEPGHISARVSRITWVAAYVAALLLLFPLLGTVPGLHGDEAWSGLRADEILHGNHTLIGMNGYTGPLHQYVLAPLFWLFGFHVWLLRFPTAVASLVCLFLYFRVVKGLFSEQLALLASVILVAMPFFTTFGRLAFEVFALNPVLALLALLLLHRSGGEESKGQLWHSIGAGICLGFGIWNHLIFLSIPAALFAVAFSRHGFRLLKNPKTYCVGYGLTLALSPRLFMFGSTGEGGKTASFYGNIDAVFSAFCGRLWEWPGLLLEIAHGDLLFQRFTGQVVFKTINLFVPLFAIGVVLMIRRAWANRAQLRSIEQEILIFSYTLFLATAFLCPRNSDRYFLFPLYLLPIFVAFGLVELGKIRCLRIPALVTLFCFVIFNLARIGTNYFVPLVQGHCRSSDFSMGSQSETSNHFIPTDQLYREIQKDNFKQVYAEFFIALPLKFYDLDKKQLSINEIWSPNELPSLTSKAGSNDSYIVVYNYGTRRVRPEDCIGCEIVFKDTDFTVLKLK